MMKKHFKVLITGCLISALILPAAWIAYWKGLKTLTGLSRQMNFYSLKSLHSRTVKSSINTVTAAKPGRFCSGFPGGSWSRD